MVINESGLYALIFGSKLESAKTLDRAIAAITKQFGVAKAKAGRLVMTESAYFASAAQKDCFTALGVEQFKIVASFDKDTCPLCGALDGKVFKMSEYQVGLTAPPFHPWCRCCTCPYFPDMEGLGERFARGADGKTYKVPGNMTYEEWAKQAGISTKNAKSPFTNEKQRDIISGGVSGALNPNGKRAAAHAERYYEEVRHMTTDVEKIAAATGYTEEQIQAVKNFIFIDEHDLGGRTARFDADYMMAESWQRLIAGKPEPHDLTLIHHEIMERDLMLEGLTQDEAHIKTSAVYNYRKEANEFYAKIKKFAKD